MIFGFKTDAGKRRTINEDSFFVMPHEKVFMVADGVGGQNAGEVASKMTVEYISSQVHEFPPEKFTDENQLKRYFLEMLRRINFHVYRAAKSDPLKKGMATTLVMLYVRDDRAYVINVGDSRAYLHRDGVLQQITEDHTYVNDLVKQGVLTREQAEKRSDKNMITRAVGAELELDPDFIMLKIYPGDIILLCSDGIHDELTDDEINEILMENQSMIGAAAALSDSANEKGGRDNITVVTVKIQSEAKGGENHGQ